MHKTALFGKTCGKTIAATTLMLASTGIAQAASQSVDLGLSNEVFSVAYGNEFRPDILAQASFLHSTSDDHRSNFLTVGLGVTSQLNSVVKPRIGAKVFVLDGKHVDANGLAVDAGVAITVVPKVVLDVSAGYSPDIVVNGDLDRYYDIGFKVGYEILPNALVYAGYQDVHGVNEGPDYEIYQGVILGFKMSF